jgi:hypothetical protein
MSDTPRTDALVMSKFATQADCHKAVRELCRQLECELAATEECRLLELRDAERFERENKRLVSALKACLNYITNDGRNYGVEPDSENDLESAKRARALLRDMGEEP